MKCRVCDSAAVQSLGTFRPYTDYSCEVFECDSCLSRYVYGEQAIYERLHAAHQSPYGAHDQLGVDAAHFFAFADKQGLYHSLARTPKNAFVLEKLGADDSYSNMLEIGCSLGYLTSYFILVGRNVYGTDISTSAINAAKTRFGDHFGVFDIDDIEARAPFDAIYHVGTIGCVDDPVGMTNQLLGWLKPGGVLVFNSPDVSSCKETGEIWVRSTPPPDLVTLFHERFWSEYFSGVAKVSIEKQRLAGCENLSIKLREALGKRSWEAPRGALFSDKGQAPKSPLGPRQRISPRFVRKLVCNLLDLPPFVSFLPRYSAEFGLFVSMSKY